MNRREFLIAIGAVTAATAIGGGGVVAADDREPIVGVNAEGRFVEFVPVNYHVTERDGHPIAGWASDARGQWYQIFGTTTVSYKVSA